MPSDTEPQVGKEITDLITSSIAQNNEKLFDRLAVTLNKTVDQLKRAHAEANDLQTREIKRIKTNEHKVFKRKGNEIQYKFNAKLEVALEETKDSINAKNPAKAIESLDEGIALIEDRQKLVLLADQSEFGWRTAAEYEQHELAKDEADEKKIRRAEERAEKASKAEAAKKKAKKQSIPPKFRFQGYPQPVSSGVQNVQNRFPQAWKKPGSCFACGRFGHWRASCPEASATSYANQSHSYQGKK